MRKFKLADSSKCRQTNSSQVPFPTEDSTNNNTVCVPDTEFQTIQFLFSSDGDVFFGNIIITLKQCDKSVNFHTVQEYFNKHRSLLSTFFDFSWAKDVSRWFCCRSCFWFISFLFPPYCIYVDIRLLWNNRTSRLRVSHRTHVNEMSKSVKWSDPVFRHNWLDWSGCGSWCFWRRCRWCCCRWLSKYLTIENCIIYVMCFSLTVGSVVFWYLALFQQCCRYIAAASYPSRLPGCHNCLS